MNIKIAVKHKCYLKKPNYKEPNKLFAENSWTQVMLGQGIMPEQYHPIVELMSEQELSQFLSQIKLQNERLVAQLPSHHTFLQSYCPAMTT
jgi:tryptophan 7-halogenase